MKPKRNRAVRVQLVLPHWVKHEWDSENPACVRCGATMGLNDGCEWDEDAAMNLCHSCALDVIREIRQNASGSAETLADIIPALERASGLKADDFRKLAHPGGLSGDEVAALWMARAIMEAPNEIS